MAIVQYKNFAYLKGPAGERGAKGDKGDRGPKGDQGPIGLTGPAGAGFDGNALTLPLILYGNPTSALEAVTRQYVDNAISSIPDPVYSTDGISEGTTNLYYTDARARSSISGTGAISYNSDTGVISLVNNGDYATQADIDNAITNLIGAAPALLNTLNELANAIGDDENFVINITNNINAKLNTADFTNTANTWLTTKSTTDLIEGANKYYTDARARSSISVVGSGSYDSSTGVITVTGGVTSVNSKSGAVTLTTSDIEENNNLYYTDARARNAVSVSGSLSYDNSTGLISYTTPNTIASLSNHTTTNLVEGANLYYTEARVDANFATKTTTALAEGTNLYFTVGRSRNSISADGSLNYNSSTGVISYTTPTTIASLSNHTTTNLVEGTNLYFTNERVDDRLDNLIVAGKGLAKSYDDAGNLLNISVDFSEFNIDDITEGAVNQYFNNKTTTNLVEGTNLYFTDARAIAANQTIIDGVSANLTAEINRATSAESALSDSIANEATLRIAGDLINSNTITAEVNRATAAEGVIANNLSNEITRAVSAENELSDNINTEATIRAASDLTNANAISTETLRATTAEDTLTTNLANEVTRATSAEDTLTTNLAAEVTRATTAEDVLTTNLANEVTRAINAEDTLTTNLAAEVTRATTAEDVLTTNLAAEVTRATNAEDVLTSAIITEEQARISGDLTNANAIGTETLRATTAENVLTTNLTAEINRATNAENTLTTNLANEVTRATNAENTLTTNLTAEINRATTAEDVLTSAINTEEQARITTDTNLQNQIDFIVSNTNPIALDSLTEIVNAFQNADNDINGAITLLGATLQDNIDAEEAARIADVSTLTNNLNSEINRATNAENTLTTNLANEVTRATNAENVLTTNLAAEVTRAINAENTLTTNLAAEVTRAINAENVLTTNLANEVTRAINAENVLTTNLAAEVTRATNAENTLTTNLANEVTRAINAENQLQSNIDDEETARIQADISIGQRIDNLTTDDIAEGTNLYYTDTRARNAISVEGTLYYDSVNGIISTFGGDVPNEVRLGSSAGLVNQGQGAIAIGRNAGNTDQGKYSIAIGAFAGSSGQANNSIVLSAVTPGPGWDNPGEDWDELSWDDIDDAVTADTAGFFVKPVRNVNTTSPIYYNPITGEISYGEFPDFALTSYVDAADDQLQSNLDAETSARIAGDETINQRIDDLTTADIREVNNLYYTEARVDDNFRTKTTTALLEGDNLYYTTARANADFDLRLAIKSTTNLGEGENLYYTEARVDANFATKTTTALIEGTNLYYTDARARAAISAGNGLNYNAATGEISIGQDVGTQADVTFNDVIVTGNLTVQGTTTSVNSTTVDIADLNLTLAKGSANAGQANGAGITIDGANATITYTSSNDSWNINKPLNVAGTVTLSSDPVNGSDAVTKNYVDNAINSIPDPISDDPTFNSVTVNGDITSSNQVVTKNYVDTQISSTLAATHSGNYTFTQSVPSNVWIINHNLGARFVDIEIIDAEGTAYDGRFDYPSISFEDPDNAVITFTEPMAGWAVVSHGVAVIGDVTELANVAVTGSYLDLRDAPPIATRTGTHTHTQDVAEYQWIVHHGLGTRFVDVEIVDADGILFDGRFDYPTITFVDADTLTVTFTEEQSGWAVISHGVTVMKNLSELAHVAVSGSYLDLRDTPPLSTRTGTHTHEQANPRIEWTVHHGLGTRFVDVEIVDENGTLFDGRFDYPTITFVDIDTLTVTFSEAQRGWAVISHGVIVIDDVTELADIARTADYSDLRNTPELFSGNYNDLTNKPTIPSLTGYATESYVNTSVSGKLAIDGGTMTGSLILNSDPVDNLEAATKQYVDNATNGIVTSYNDLTDKPTIPTDVSELSDNYNLLGSGGGGSGASTWGDITFDGGVDYVDTSDNYNNSEVILKADDLDAITMVPAPITSSSEGTTGQVAYDNNYVYVCVATNTWKRSPLTSW
jgi:hypothetical protein